MEGHQGVCLCVGCVCVMWLYIVSFREDPDGAFSLILPVLWKLFMAIRRSETTKKLNKCLNIIYNLLSLHVIKKNQSIV